MASVARELAYPDAAGHGSPSDWDASQPQWTAVLADLETGESVGDLRGADEVERKFVLNRPGVIKMKLPLTHPIGLELLQRKGEGLIKVYKRKQLAMVAEVLTAQPAGDAQGRWIAVVAKEAPYVRLGGRMVGKGPGGVTYTDLDRGAIAQAMVDEANAEDPTGIFAAAVFSSTVVTVGPWYFKKIIEGIVELGGSVSGYDHWFTPADPFVDANGAIAYLNIAPLRGGVKPEAIFEFGVGRANVASYSWQIDATNRITRAYSLPPSYPDNVGLVLTSSADATLEARIGRREEIVQNDLVDNELRQLFVDEVVNVRKNPRLLYTFQPDIDDLSRRVPSPLFDYNVGDIVRARVNDSGVLFLDGWVRVYGITVKTDQAGTESVELVVIDEDGESE